jgi:hypothetical protein
VHSFKACGVEGGYDSVADAMFSSGVDAFWKFVAWQYTPLPG